MATYRIYSTKDTTIIENSPTINTGLNEVAELWFGVSGLTRHLIKFDVDAYQAKHAIGLVPHVSGTTATLNLTNCYPHQNTDNVSASSVEIEIHALTRDFNEGEGNDFISNVVDGFANWTSAAVSNTWTSPGGDIAIPVMFTGTVDEVDGDLVASVTTQNELNSMFTGTNHGLAVKYTAGHEEDITEDKTVFKFYSNNTHTLNRPYIELTWDDQITDERQEIYAGTTKRIYLYVKKDGILTNANSVSNVTIRYSELAQADELVTTINNPQPGIYYIDFTCADVDGTFIDSWTVQYESGSAIVQVEQSGIILDPSANWSNDTDEIVDPTSYNIMIPNFKSEFKQGEYVYLDINAVELYTSNIMRLKNLEYSISMVDGTGRITMADWAGVSYSDTDNFIRFDSTWLPTGNLFELKFRHKTDSMTYVDVLDRQFRVEE